MPTPRQAAQKTGSQLSGEPSGYCGACGLPGAQCQCSNYKEHGAAATNAGSADANDPFAGKNMKGGNGNGSPFEKKEE